MGGSSFCCSRMAFSFHFLFGIVFFPSADGRFHKREMKLENADRHIFALSLGVPIKD
jgi:hypothetical protein